MSIVAKESVALAAKEIEAKWDLIKRMYCKGCSDDEAAIFFEVCKRTGLNPIQRQIYAIKYGPQMNIITGIDGFRLIAERTGKYSPGKASEFTYDEKGKLVSAIAYVKKLTDDGTWHEVSHVAYMEEYNGGKGNWSKMPRVMLSKCAEAQALRKAFPGDLSGIYSTEEMDQAEPAADQIKNQAPAKLSEEQSAQLDMLFQHLTEEEIKNLLGHLKLNDIHDLNPKSFDKVIRAVEKKLEQKKEKADGSIEIA